MSVIGINAQLISDEASYRRAGIHHYITQVLGNLPSAAPMRYLVYTRTSGTGESPFPHANVRVTRWPTENRWVRILWEQLAWPLAAMRDGVDLLHSMAFVTPLWPFHPTIVTVYDLSFFHFPDRYPRLQRLYLQTQTRRSCRRATRIVTISAAGREDVHELLGISKERIDIVRPGVDAHFQPQSDEAIDAFRRHHQLPPRYILHVGTLQPRKNIPILLDALARLNRPELLLVLVGGKGWFYEEIFARIEALELQEQVHFAGYVPDAELPLWYAAATMLIFPSVYEGFGMPILQAMACGTPVLAAASSALPEAAGDAARLFPPHDVEILISQILAVLENEEEAATMRERGLRHARKYTWKHAGEAMVSAYKRALAGRIEDE